MRAKFYTVQQVAELLEVSTRTVRRWIDADLPRFARGVSPLLPRRFPDLERSPGKQLSKEGLYAQDHHSLAATGSEPMIPLAITITPVETAPGRYQTRLDDRLLIKSSSEPFVDSARFLIALA